MTNLYGSICLSDIPNELITESKNGKKYLNIEVTALRQPSQYGATHAVKMSCKKADRKEGVNYYIGNLKPSKFGNEDATAAQTAPPVSAPQYEAPATNNNDLPF
jgi:hypothetical protein